MRGFSMIQSLGKSLMLPIAVLPVAGILLRLGQPDLLDMQFVAAAGNAVFANLGLLFAIGIAVGLAKGSNGAAGLAAIVAYFITTEGAKALVAVPPELLVDALEQTKALISNDYKNSAINKLSVPAGLICGVLAGAFYNRFSDIRLPDYLAFFAGRRFVPIVTGFAALPVAFIFGHGWPILESGMNGLSAGIVGAGELGLFAYGALNRILIVSGLHHILNNLAWFIVGDFEGVTGDLRRFFAGDPDAGVFMSGFFPVMMFGLPAACLAMYRTAHQDQRAKVGGLLLSMALTSFLTGITEPIEFAFMFLAPLLFLIHAVLTGLSMVIMDLLEVRLGFGFSAGLFDYVLNYNQATRPWMLLPVGAAYFAIYYLTFRFFILKFNLKTLGRSREEIEVELASASDSNQDETQAFVSALGGASNLLSIDACMTRLRLEIASSNAIDEAQLKVLGAAGVVKPSANTVQVIVGLRADEIAGNMRAALESPVPPKVDKVDNGANNSGLVLGRELPANDPQQTIDVTALSHALGGLANITQARAGGTRMRIRLSNDTLVNDHDLCAMGYRGVAQLNNGFVQVIAHDDVQATVDALNLLLATEQEKAS